MTRHNAVALHLSGFVAAFREKLARQEAGRFEVLLARLHLRFSPSARFRIYRMLARLIEAEIDARTALEFVFEVTSNDGANPNELDAIAVRHWIAAYREHGNLAEAMTGWIPTQEVLLIEAGERAGRFQHALKVMLQLNDRISAIRGQIAGKLAYPVVAALMLCGVLYYLSNNFLPAIVQVAPSTMQWTGTAATVVGLLEWAQLWLIAALVGAAALVVLIFATLPFFCGPVRRVLDRIAPWSVHRFTTGVGFLAGLLVLLESGRSLTDALMLIRPNASPYLAATLDRVQRSVREGEDFGTALAQTGEQFPDLELIKEIQIYSRIGRLEENLLPLVQSWMETATGKALRQITVLSNLVLFAAFGVLGLTFNGFYDIISQLTQGAK